jgi:hypothetical protein
VCGLALAACGTEEPAGESSASDRESRNRDAALAFAKCMREHGVDIPDPQPGERGIRIMPGKGVSPEQQREADEACRKHLEGLEPPELSEEQEQKMRDAALAHARCLREHGIDVPDPTFDEDGGIQMRIGGGPNSRGPKPGDPKFEKAQEACRDTMPILEEDSP